MWGHGDTQRWKGQAEWARPGSDMGLSHPFVEEPVSPRQAQWEGRLCREPWAAAWHVSRVLVKDGAGVANGQCALGGRGSACRPDKQLGLSVLCRLDRRGALCGPDSWMVW